jgi:hypothetical protein
MVLRDEGDTVPVRLERRVGVVDTALLVDDH